MQIRPSGRLSLEARTQVRIGGDGIEIQAVEERAHVQSGTTDDDREPSTARDVGERGARLALISRDVVPLDGVGDIDEMVRYSRALLRGRLRGTDREAAVHLARIRRDDLAIVCLRDVERERALARRCRADDRYHRARLGGPWSTGRAWLGSYDPRIERSSDASAARARTRVTSWGRSSP